MAFDAANSELSGVTGVNSNSLQDHHPDSPGDEARHGDFLIDQIGYLGTDSDLTTLQSTGAGTYYPADNDHSIAAREVEVIVDVWREPGASYDGNSGGRLWPETGGLNGAAFTVYDTTGVSIKGRTVVGSRTDNPIRMHIIFEVTGFDNIDLALRLVDGYNTHVAQYNTSLTWSSSDVVNATDIPIIYESSIYTLDDGTNEMEVQWTPYDPQDDLYETGHGYVEWAENPGGFTGPSGSTTDQTFTFFSDYSDGSSTELQLKLCA